MSVEREWCMLGSVAGTHTGDLEGAEGHWLVAKQREVTLTLFLQRKRERRTCLSL